MFFDSLKLNEKEHLIRINNEIDNNLCLALKEEVINLVSNKNIFIRINLEKTDFINTAGIGLLLSIHFELQKLDGKLIIENPQTYLNDLFEATRATKYLLIQNNNEE
ncbi:MAG: STAS domain-containing protein [Candidatus Sericytochromatia bacterium]|nr:STAS domain-containing protein [Candidatus Sericytochromatia bacterium]